MLPSSFPFLSESNKNVFLKMVGHSQRAYQSISPLISSSQHEGCSPRHSCQSTLGNGRHCLSYLQFQCGNPSAVQHFCWKIGQVPLWLPLRNRTSFCFVFVRTRTSKGQMCFLWGFFGTGPLPLLLCLLLGNSFKLCLVVCDLYKWQIISQDFFFFKSSNTNLLFPYPKRKGIFTSKK